MNITAKGLTKIYGSGENRVVALDKADLQIASKEFISIMGPSGSGKSTLLHLLSGLDRPSSGSLTYDGRDIYSMGDRELSAFRRRRIGFVFQQFNLLPVLTARENIIMPLLLDKKAAGGSLCKAAHRCPGAWRPPDASAGGAVRRAAAAGGHCTGADCAA